MTEYPTAKELAKIEEWAYDDLPGLMEYLEEIGFCNYGTIRETDEDYFLSTGGWSGNESMIHALESNTMIWIIYWKQSSRGGHYIFEKRKKAKGELE